MSKEGSAMAECGRLGSGGAWMRMLVVFVTGSFLAGCVSVEAIEVLRKAATLPLYATPDKAYINLGAALQQQGDVPGAIRAYQDALKIDPPNVPRALVYLELGRLHMKQGEDSKAREALAQVKALDPQGTAGAEAAKMMKQLR